MHKKRLGRSHSQDYLTPEHVSAQPHQEASLCTHTHRLTQSFTLKRRYFPSCLSPPRPYLWAIESPQQPPGPWHSRGTEEVGSNSALF